MDQGGKINEGFSQQEAPLRCSIFHPRVEGARTSENHVEWYKGGYQDGYREGYQHGVLNTLAIFGNKQNRDR